eukprot:scaffold167080_cov30-Tisochrysis_lutea.AAC.1
MDLSPHAADCCCQASARVTAWPAASPPRRDGCPGYARRRRAGGVGPTPSSPPREAVGSPFPRAAPSHTPPSPPLPAPRRRGDLRLRARACDKWGTISKV